ncbi:MAG TPA: metal ABC transporter substrate-binding protein [Acidimicrobiales bacterium]|nr:metal ABC transporter substrate-binding protein [Acidimicrobiales bacterium]
MGVGKQWAKVASALSLALLGAACGSGAGAAADDPAKLNIVTTVSPLTSIVSSVVGERAEVRGLVPEGVNSHTFEPPPSAARTLARADLVFVNGLKLEDPTRELAAGNLKAGAEVVELGDRTIGPDEYMYDFSFPREDGKPNPHLWTNPPYAKDYARIVRDTVARRDPAHADEYTANYERFAGAVDELDGAMKAATATVPRRELLTYHDAYAYFARHYGWKVIGAVQVSSFEEPTPREVAGLIQQVRQVGVPAIFGSEVFPSKVLAQIGAEAGVRYVDTLRDDDLPGRPGDPDHSWLGLMRFDFVTMVESLGGDASPLKAVQAAGGPDDRAVYPQ